MSAVRGGARNGSFGCSDDVSDFPLRDGRSQAVRLPVRVCMPVVRVERGACPTSCPARKSDNGGTRRVPLSDMDRGSTVTRLRPCLGRCGVLVSSASSRCYACRLKASRQYDATRPAHHAVYRTPEWRRLSAALRAAATRCHWCLKPTRRLVADHVIPLSERPDLALDRGNLVASCFSCNTRRGKNSKLPDLEAAS